MALARGAYSNHPVRATSPFPASEGIRSAARSRPRPKWVRPLVLLSPVDGTRENVPERLIWSPPVGEGCRPGGT